MPDQYIRVARCIYRLAGTKRFFHCVRLPGKPYPTKRLIKGVTTLTAAVRQVEIINTRRHESRLGIGLDPYASLDTVELMAKQWIKCDCPNRDGRARLGTSLEAEMARLHRALPFWKHKSVQEIIAYEDCPDYHKWRVRQKRNPELRLGRSVDAELTTLSNLFQWAVQNPRKTGLKYNPLATRPRFDNPKLVRHCTKVMPVSDEDFHVRANYLLASDKTRKLGWQYLLEGLTGCRTSEILACRVDARFSGQPGYMDHHALHVHRCKDGIEPWALLESAAGHDPLRDCLQAFLNWHEQRYPKSPWFIPGKTIGEHADRCSLTHALHRAGEVLGLPLVTSHGLRAYHVDVLRSMGISDEEIAARLGHRSTQQVEDTYGKVKPGFRGSWQLDFLPEDFAPAWTNWLPKKPYQKLIKPETKESNGKQNDPGVISEKRQ